ncbi:MAG: M20/M25/M40 family metallo-hydrolase, partial [Bacteroidia bacterium]|nr:M20/M25/M40 family metallo-hydrolase [Bacteroidia bacterium]
MTFRFSLLLVLVFNLGITSSAQNSKEQDSLVIKSIFNEALLNGQSYENLNYLCKVIGHRLTGSVQAQKAIEWAEGIVLGYGIDRVMLQGVDAPHWVRGEKDWVALSEEIDIALNACALGGSVGTNGPLQADVVEVNGVEDLKNYTNGELAGKIVFFNKHMDKSKINTFEAYGACVSQRYWGASEASRLGAVAVLVRSMTTLTDIYAHTGSMGYKEGISKIPAAAISTQDADILHTYIQDLGSAKVTMNLNCYTAPNVYTHNVIGEIKGSEFPEEIIVFGAHIDSWDKGEGAHDDGAGVVQCMEILRIFNMLKIKPKHTIRMVLYINEENGNMGGKTYAERARKDGESHICAIESDRGGFTPRGFSIDANSNQLSQIQSWKDLLEPYGLHYFKKGYGGVDINPLKSEENIVNPNLMLIGLYPDPQRYFD